MRFPWNSRRSRPSKAPTPADVLAQLDESAEEFSFADLNHPYYYTVDARLRVYGDGSRWAIVIDTLGYSPRGGNLVDVVHTYGNCITDEDGLGYVDESFLHRIENWDDIEDPDDSTWTGNGTIVIGGVPIAVDAPKGEELQDTLRRLVPEHRDLLLSDDEEALRRLPSDLPLVLQLEEWNHPEDASETPPSEHESMQQLARVAATADPSHYAPTMPPNTHWTNWPESGSL